MAIYADAEDEARPAAEAGFEGVACVDDAARAVELLCEVFTATGDRRILAWATGLLDFVLWMHTGDGRWVNFVYDWQGTRNLDGRTSRPGVNFWQARALCALARASEQMDHRPGADALDAGLRDALAAAAPPDVRALHMVALTRRAGPEPSPHDLARLRAAGAQILDCSEGGMLMNSAEEHGRPHLWGHIQEGVLAGAGRLLGDEDMVAAARHSADLVFAEAIESGFETAHMQPYGVQSAVFVMDRLGEVTGAPEYARLALLARMWFGTRNPAALAVYDRVSGRVSDGIDGGRLNSHSGAESNIAAGLALVDDAAALVRAQPTSGPLFGLVTPAG